MEAALEEPVYKVGNIQTRRRELKRPRSSPAQPGLGVGGAAQGACNKYGPGPQGRAGGTTAGVGDRVGQGCLSPLTPEGGKG